MPSTRRCVFGCNTTGVTLHRFPNPGIYQERFRIWVGLAGDSYSGQTDINIYKNRRVCDRHFAEKFKNRNSRLSALAIPHLHISKALTPVASTGSVNLLSNLPGTSVQLSGATTPLTQKEIYVCPTTSEAPLASCSSVRMEYYQNARKQIRNLRSEICRLRKRGKKIKERLQHAEKFSSKVMLQTLTKKMSLPAKIFTAMQFRECGKKPKGQRFLKEEKELALALYKRSPKCYALLSKCFALPSAKSLKTLLAKIVMKEGVNPIIFNKLASNVKYLPNDERLCVLMFDEIYINPQVRYNEREDKIKGLDSFNNRKIADHALTFMIKTIKKPKKLPVAYYLTNCLNAIQLKSAIKEVVHEMNSAGFKILATVCDHSRVNVSAIQSLVGDAKRSYLRKGKEWRHDIFIVDSVPIIPIFDVPHLITGIRNNLLNKDVMYVDFKDNEKVKIVKWEYFQKIYEADKIDGELKFLHRLTEEHVYVDKRNKMKVKLATQLLSNSVAVAANHLTKTGQLNPVCRQVIPFVKMFDNLFDSLNCYNCEVDGKIYRAGVKINSPHHTLWTEATRFLRNLKFLEKKVDGNKVIMIEKKNIPSVTNFIKTIEGMHAIWKVLNKKYGFYVMFCRNFNQDPIQNFFGRIRGVGARNVSPNSICFEGAYKALLLNNFSSSHSIKSNCEDDIGAYFHSLDFIIDEKNYEEQEKDFTTNHEFVLSEELLLDTINVQPMEGAGQRGYFFGWVITKCLKYISKCKTCRNDFIDDKNIESNALISAKKYNNVKKWLVYPSIEVTNLFAKIQRITESILKNNVPTKNLRNSIIMIVDNFVIFPFKCEKHKTLLKKYFVSKTINVLIYSWCRIINKILNGKIKYDGTDEIKKYAHEYYTKRKNMVLNNKYMLK